MSEVKWSARADAVAALADKLLFLDDPGGTPTSNLDTIADILDLQNAETKTLTNKTITDLNLTDPTTLTIAIGKVTATQTLHLIDTEGAAATDNLDEIAGAAIGDILIIKSVDSARDPQLRDNTGTTDKCQTAGNFTLSTIADSVTLLAIANDGTAITWNQLSRANNASWGWKCPEYVAYFTDDDETEIISEMKRNHKNIVPAIQVNHQNVNDIKLKWFDGSDLRIQSPTAISDRILLQRLKVIAKIYLPKHRIQKDNSLTPKQKQNQIRGLGFPFNT